MILTMSLVFNFGTKEILTPTTVWNTARCRICERD